MVTYHHSLRIQQIVVRGYGGLETSRIAVMISRQLRHGESSQPKPRPDRHSLERGLC